MYLCGYNVFGSVFTCETCGRKEERKKFVDNQMLCEDHRAHYGSWLTNRAIVKRKKYTGSYAADDIILQVMTKGVMTGRSPCHISWCFSRRYVSKKTSKSYIIGLAK